MRLLRRGKSLREFDCNMEGWGEGPDVERNHMIPIKVLTKRTGF
jgi:hypothetical protein